MSSIDSFFYQSTTARPAAISGVGIHSGRSIELTLRPAPPNTGIRFRRTDSGGVEIPSLASHVSSLELATSLGKDDVCVSTVEHLLAALQVLGVDNLIVEVDGPEIPILDGSARPFLHLVEAAGVSRQDALRRVLAVTSPLEVTVGDKRIAVSPYPGLRVTYRVDFPGSAIGEQTLDLEITRESFERELAAARTFALERDVDQMRRAGLGLGGGPDNCIVFDDERPINTTLRWPDEPVRHKALDALGDLALLGCPLWGHVEVNRGGHLVHFRLIEALQQHPECWTWMQAEPVADTAMRALPHPFLRPAEHVA